MVEPQKKFQNPTNRTETIQKNTPKTLVFPPSRGGFLVQKVEEYPQTNHSIYLRSPEMNAELLGQLIGFDLR